MVTIDTIYEAQQAIKDTAVVTPVISTSKIAENVYIKCEHLQKTGSFKLRGACFKVSKLSEEEKSHGVIACSAGNHAQGVALSATKMGIPSVVCMPKAAPISKVQATKGYGAEVILVDGVYDDAYKQAKELQEEKGYTFLHPFDDPYVIAGQGTIGLEILQQVPDVDAVVVPIGGGGLISGVALAIKTLKPSCKVFGVQAEGAPSMYNSITHDTIETLDSVSTIADGIAVKTPGNITFALCKQYVDEIFTVTEKEIATAILTLVERHKTTAEGAGAVAAAAVQSGKIDATKYKKVVCVVSGGNIDVTVLSKVITKGLVYAGRISEVSVKMVDKPGELQKLLSLISDTGANIKKVSHKREIEEFDIHTCQVTIKLETRDSTHKQELYSALKKHGYEHYVGKN